MNPLTHAHFALELFKEDNLSQDEKDHLIVGSFLPDIHITGLIQFHKTHNQGLEFFHSLTDPLHKFLALGMITHGEYPQGLDYHTHNSQGFIKQKHSKVLPLAQKYKKSIGKLNGSTVHYLIEFSVDNLIAERDPTIVKQVLSAFKNPKVRSAITAFSHFLGFSEKKNNKIINLLRNKHLLNYFYNFSSPETASQNWLNLTFYRNIKRGKNLPFREKFKKLTKFTYYNFKRKINDEHITKLFYEINSQLRPSIPGFLTENKNKIIELKNDLLRNIRSTESRQ